MPTIAEWRGPLPALTTDQMREVDRAMIEDIGITLIQMMENAGRHLATLAREQCDGNVASKNIVVLAGRGNNGGGGLVAARRLANWGASVAVILIEDEENYRDVPAHQLAILRKMGAPISSGMQQSVPLQQCDLILDALIGYGLRGAPRGVTADLIRTANASGVKTPALPSALPQGKCASSARVIALDAPSGLDTATGHAFDPCVRANATLTLALPKIGLLKEKARGFVGELYVADISVPPRVYARMGIQVPNLFAEAEILRVPARRGEKADE